MSWTKNLQIRCDGCGLFCSPVDGDAPFDASAYEPPEQADYCLKCAFENYRKWYKHFENGGRSGDWQKSQAERWAAEKFDLVWLHSYGVGTFGTDDYMDNYQWIDKADYERLSKLPRYKERVTTHDGA